MRLDETDLSLVRELQSDARQSNVSLARKVGLTEGAVRRRIDNLLASGAFKIVAVADPEALGLSLHAVIGLRVELDRLEELSEELARMRELSYVYETTGQFDLIVVGFFSAKEQLREFLTRRVGGLRGIVRTDTFLVMRTAKRSMRWGEAATERTTVTAKPAEILAAGGARR